MSNYKNIRDNKIYFLKVILLFKKVIETKIEQAVLST